MNPGEKWEGECRTHTKEGRPRVVTSGSNFLIKENGEPVDALQVGTMVALHFRALGIMGPQLAESLSGAGLLRHSAGSSETQHLPRHKIAPVPDGQF